MRADGFAGQLIQALSRRTPAFQPGPGKTGRLSLEIDRSSNEQRRMRWERYPSVPDAPDAWLQWAAYYRGLAEQARVEHDIDSASTYDSLAETYRTLRGRRGHGEGEGT